MPGFLKSALFLKSTIHTPHSVSCVVEQALRQAAEEAVRKVSAEEMLMKLQLVEDKLRQTGGSE